MGPLERAKLLLSKAYDDEILLEEIVPNEKITDEIIGFHAQQAAEKLLKALLMARVWMAVECQEKSMHHEILQRPF